MKKIIYLLAFCHLAMAAVAQLHIAAGTQLVNTGAVQSTLNNLDLVNDGNLQPGAGTFGFTGDATGSIRGLNATAFFNLYIAKPGAKKMMLETSLSVQNNLTFVSGYLDLNNNNIDLGNTGTLINEGEGSRIIGASGGYVLRTQTMNAPFSINAGNLGAEITSSANMGTVLIRRGHKTQTGNGMSSSIARYYDIIPSNNANLNATLRFHYFDGELNGTPEGVLGLFKSANNGVTWSPQADNGRNASYNFLEKNNIADFSRWTLSAIGALPVTGLTLTAHRTGSQVLLNWKTVQEISCKGFYAERRKDNESSFTSIVFVPTRAPGGNSGTPLAYETTDQNNFPGKTYYRLRQEDLNGQVSYSTVCMVNGDDGKMVSLSAWPSPNTGSFQVRVDNGAQDEIQIWNAAGQLLERVPISGGQVYSFSHFAQGVYFVRLKTDPSLSQKIIVQ